MKAANPIDGQNDADKKQKIECRMVVHIYQT
jgi:hypothetical protein